MFVMIVLYGLSYNKVINYVKGRYQRKWEEFGRPASVFRLGFENPFDLTKPFTKAVNRNKLLAWASQGGDDNDEELARAGRFCWKVFQIWQMTFLAYIVVVILIVLYEAVQGSI